MKHRLPSLDWMRGIVMILMATDHASGAYNAGRLITDSPFFYTPETQLPALQFLYRWASHLCAPSFLFLAGTGLALSIGRRLAKGVASSAIDRDLLLRGLLIVSIEFVVIHWFWLPEMFLLQVMYAIGCSLLLMIPLRRLAPAWLSALALIVLVGSEFLIPAEITSTGGTFVAAAQFLIGGGMVGKFFIAYPVLHWWAMMALGWAFGSYLQRGDDDRARTAGRTMLCWGIAALAIFAVVRAINGFGNMNLLRLDGSLIQWLHTSKYPPSISFVTMELGLMAIILAGLFHVQRRVGETLNTRNPILVFGQTPFFFYVLHILLFELSARAIGLHKQMGLGTTCIATIVILAVAYPICLWYRSYKAAHRESWLRFF